MHLIHTRYQFNLCFLVNQVGHIQTINWKVKKNFLSFVRSEKQLDSNLNLNLWTPFFMIQFRGKNRQIISFLKLCVLNIYTTSSLIHAYISILVLLYVLPPDQCTSSSLPDFQLIFQRKQMMQMWRRVNVMIQIKHLQ